jgi:multiple sugar transport system permease protein
MATTTTAAAPARTRIHQHAGGRRRPGRLRRRLGDNLMAYAFLAAGLLCFGLFSWYPLVRSITLSLQQDNLVTDPQWVGLDNYRTLFTSTPTSGSRSTSR